MAKINDRSVTRAASSLLLSVLSLTLALATSPAQAAGSNMIEFGSGTPAASATAGSALTIDRFVNSPVFQKNRAQIQALAEAQLASATSLPDEVRESLAKTLQELPFHRIADVEVSFISGIPDVVGLCLEGFPTNNLAIEACAGTMIFLSSLSLNVKYRWDLVLKQNEKGRIHNLQFGPGAGIRYMEGICFDACQNPALGADLLASLEYTYWLSHKFGFQVQLDAGIDMRIHTIENGYSSDTLPNGWLPIAKIMVGVAF